MNRKMKCLINIASDIASANYGLTCHVTYSPARQVNDGSWSSPLWTVKMKFPNVRKSAYIVFGRDDHGYAIHAIKQNNFSDELFDSITDGFLRKANQVSANAEASTLASA